MLLDAILSFLHFTFAFILVGALSAEAFVLRLQVDERVTRLLLRIDVFYGIAAVGVIVAGVCRVFFGTAGAAYYAAQPFFWAKMAAFAGIGIISIWPTRAFIGWVKNGPPDEAGVKRIKRLVMTELHLLVLVPLFAALMARGIGM
jgi:putative membrane protein